ncbi:carboxypeptidase [Echria macrotheca]|uniref:Carboxypeptidase n=1 Tax=Echria macrotheca TaxID=438768 RepID=A0AAJ0BMG0_9PEZI|nr:carboxypeptidase [Echria macrotheca]
MRWTHAFSLLASATTVLATINFNHFHPELTKRRLDAHTFRSTRETAEKRQTTVRQSVFLNSNSTKFAVNGTGIPEVDFDVGESYAGNLPIDNNNPENQLFFWFFPSTNPVAQENKEILIWLTGGPGCSSVGELLQENGPMLWVPGTFKPVANKWSWHHLTNVVWVDQPVGSGFSLGTPTARDENDVAQQFLGFWQNFVNTFALQGYKIYITGSSYSGMYVPYISSAMLDKKDPVNYNVTGMMIFDGLYSKDPVARDIPVATFVEQWKGVLPFNDSFSKTIQQQANQCGYTDYLTRFMVFPPAGVQPASLPGYQPDDTPRPECNLFLNVYVAALELNPCFDIYEISSRCPFVLDPLGFTSGTNFLPDGFGPVYFNRQDVKAAINAPLNHTWEFCASAPVFVNNTDLSQNAGPGSQPVIPRVIEATNNVLIGHGSRDFVLIADGTLLTIQNLTWNGKLGFQTRPTQALYIPYHDNEDVQNVAGAGVIGTAHTERGLTYFGVAPSGHFLTQDQPAVAFRGVEILLGRIPNFQSTLPFTTDTNSTVQPQSALGNGTFASLFVDGEFGIRATDGGLNAFGNVPGTSQSLGSVLSAGVEGKTVKMGVVWSAVVVGLVALL